MEYSSEPQVLPPPPKKAVPFKWLVVIICLILIIIIQSVFLSTFFTKNQTLIGDYSSLQTSYNKLNNDYVHLQSNYDAYVDAYERIRAQINIHSTHPTEDETQLVTPTDPEVVSIMLQVSGGWSNPSDWNEFWDDQKKLYDWVVSNIEYANDLLYPSLEENPSSGLSWSEDNWQFPNETLRTKQGDCEDQALLLLSLILAYTSQSYDAYFIAITGHAAMFIPVSVNEICILDPAGHYTTNSGWPYYYLTGKDMRQEVYDWLNHVGENPKVYQVFDNTLWKEFSGTEDFVTWLYNTY